MKAIQKFRSTADPSVDASLQQISVVLMLECHSCKTDGKLSKALRDKLESQSRERRSDIVRVKHEGCAPLFVAAKRGLCTVVEYLITVCAADVEQTGHFVVPEDRSVHRVTPLWCAAVSGQLPVLKVLLRHRCAINAASDTGSTPVRSACFMTNLEVVHYLVDNGADIRRANYNGGTCLINAVQSVPLVLFLLSKGADVNAKDIQDKTALHYAIQEHRLETTRLLMKSGADPFAKSRYGDDALQTACLKGAHQIFDYLKHHVVYSTERLANAYELIGSTFLDEHNETRVAILHWRLAHHTRMKVEPYLPKMPAVPPRRAYGYATEFNTAEQLENIELDVDAMRVQSLLICDRVLGLGHKDSLFRLMFRGASYADSLRFQRCIELWQLALETRVQRFTILYSDTCFTAQALVRLMLDLYDRHFDVAANEIAHRDEPMFEDVMTVLELLTAEILETSQLLQLRPVYNKQQENFDRVLLCVTHLIYLALETAVDIEQRDRLLATVRPMIQMDVRTTRTRDSLLHLSVSKTNVIISVYFAEDADTRLIFPNVEVVRFLLKAGIAVNALNQDQSSPLHVASIPYNYDGTLVKLMLDSGAHIDQPDLKGDRPVAMIAANPRNVISTMHYTTLKCLAATVIAKYKIPYRSQLPQHLEEVVRLHSFQPKVRH